MGINIQKLFVRFAHTFLLASLLFAPPSAAQDAPRTDEDARPLPERAVCRLGSRHLLHDDFVTSAVFSPDGSKLASVGIADGVRIWEWPSAKPIRHFTAQRKYPQQFYLARLKFTPDSKSLAIWWPKQLTIIDVASGAVSLKDEATSLPVFGEDEAIAWQVEPKLVALRDRRDRTRNRYLHAGAPLLSIVFQGGYLIGAEREGRSVVVRNLERGAAVRTLELPDEAEWAQFLDGGKRLAFFTKSKAMNVIDVDSGKEVFERSSAPKEVPERFPPREYWTAQAVRDDGKRLLLSAGPGILWDLEKARPISYLVSSYVGAGSFSPDGKLLATGGPNGPHAAMFWDGNSGSLVEKHSGHHAHLGWLALAPSGLEAATTSRRPDPGGVHLWNTTTGRTSLKFRSPSFKDSFCVDYSRNGKRLVVGSGWATEQDVVVYDAASRKPLAGARASHFYSVGLSSDGGTLATVAHPGEKCETAIWDLATVLGPASDVKGPVSIEKPVALKSELGPHKKPSFLLDDSVVTVELREGLHFWHWRTDRVRPMALRDQRAFSQDGWLAAELNSKRVRLIEILTGAEIWSAPFEVDIKVNRYFAYGLAIAPRSSLIAASKNDGVVSLFDWNSDLPPRTFQASEVGPTQLSFSGSGTRLAGIERDTALVWDVADILKANRTPMKSSATIDEIRRLAQGSLRSPDAKVAHGAIAALVSRGDESVELLKSLLPRANEKDDPIAAWMVDGKASESALHQVRSLMTIERIGTSGARELLADLAKGHADAFLTREARRALDRMLAAE